MNIDFMAKLPPWPNQDPAGQVFWINRLKELLTTLDDRIENALVYTVLLEQATQPTQGDWETAYTTQTGLSLPIPPNTVLQWWDTTNDRFGGLYGTLSNSDGTVYPRDNRYAPGQVIDFASANKIDAVNVTTGISAIISTQPTVTLNLVVPARLRMGYSLMTDLTASSGTWGIDFTINGVKVGGQYYNIASNRGLTERNNDGVLRAEAETPVLAAGTYVIQALFGVTSGTPTVAIGGNSGVRLLWAEAVAE